MTITGLDGTTPSPPPSGGPAPAGGDPCSGPPGGFTRIYQIQGRGNASALADGAEVSVKGAVTNITPRQGVPATG